MCSRTKTVYTWTRVYVMIWSICVYILCWYVKVRNAYIVYCVIVSDTYFGPGTVDTIKCHLNAADSGVRGYVILFIAEFLL